MALSLRLESFIHEIDACASAGQIFSLFEQNLQTIDIEKFAYWLIWPADGQREPFCITNYADAWSAHYLAEGYASLDYVGRHAAQSVVPFNWHDLAAHPELTKKQTQIFQEGAEAGLRSGSSIPIHGPGRAKAVFSIANDMPNDAFQRIFARHKHELQLMVNYTHEKIMRLYRNEPSAAVPALTAREIEILKWMSRGKSRWEAGVILGISEDTVRVHLEKTRGKMGASNTMHAIALAFRHGLLTD